MSKPQPMGETNISQLIRMALSAVKIGARVFRNNVGKFKDETGRWVSFGLCPGSADLIGWRTLTITPEMVGQKIAQFVSVEVKGPKTVIKQDQIGWDIAVRNAGGISGIVRSVDEAEALFGAWPPRNTAGLVPTPLCKRCFGDGNEDAGNGQNRRCKNGCPQT